MILGKGEEKRKKKMNEDRIAQVNKLVRKHSRNELARLCKEKNLSCVGTKHDMAVRLMGGLEETKTTVEEHNRKIVIKRNAKGQWEYEGLIFDDRTKNVVCRSDGEALQRPDIEKCRQYKFRYVLPDILEERKDDSKVFTNDPSSDEEEEDGDGDETQE